MQQKKILIVEDEGVVALSLQSILTKLGYTIIGNAITGDEAITLARERQPDVILMDIHIKGSLDGIQTTEKINEFSDVPVIYLTAYADDETVSRAIKTRSHSYLVKPVNQRELYSNIEFAIYKRRLKDRAGTSQENLELFLTNLREAGFVMDLKNRIVFSNSAAEVLTGYTAEDMKGVNFFNLMNLAPSQRGDAGDDAIQKILALEAIDYLPPVATFSTKSGKRNTILIRTGMIREDKDECKNLFILIKEMDPANLSPEKPA
jgi:PAS domain S-box-containing protein